jgi:NADH:ubiquinone reductase (H+-translocating)
MSGERRRIAIVGGGFGGLAAAQALRKVNVEVTLVDRTNHHLFQPLLYQLAASGLSMGDCAAPIRGMLRHQRNAQVAMAEVTDVDPERGELTLDRGERIGYDSLIVACGAATSYFGHDEWAEPSFSLKTLADAVELRDHILASFEEAERTSDADVQRRLQTFVVIGGGPTGIEIAGQLAVLSRHHMKGQFARFDPAATRIVVLDAGDRVLAAFSPKLSAKAAHELGELGVEVLEGARATAIDADGVTFEQDGKPERIEANTVIWAAGVQTAPFARTLADATGAAHDRGGRLEVAPDCSLPGHPEISVIGDAAAHPGPDGKPLPGLATVAIQQARHVAKGIASGSPGATAPFRYFDKGALAVIGRGRAICAVRGIELSGPLAFGTYLGVHLFYLGGVPGRRITVLSKWASTAFGREQSRIIERELPRPRVQV